MGKGQKYHHCRLIATRASNGRMTQWPHFTSGSGDKQVIFPHISPSFFWLHQQSWNKHWYWQYSDRSSQNIYKNRVVTCSCNYHSQGVANGVCWDYNPIYIIYIIYISSISSLYIYIYIYIIDRGQITYSFRYSNTGPPTRSHGSTAIALSSQGNSRWSPSRWWRGTRYRPTGLGDAERCAQKHIDLLKMIDL